MARGKAGAPSRDPGYKNRPQTESPSSETFIVGAVLAAPLLRSFALPSRGEDWTDYLDRELFSWIVLLLLSLIGNREGERERERERPLRVPRRNNIGRAAVGGHGRPNNRKGNHFPLSEFVATDACRSGGIYSKHSVRSSVALSGRTFGLCLLPTNLVTIHLTRFGFLSRSNEA